MSSASTAAAAAAAITGDPSAGGTSRGFNALMVSRPSSSSSRSSGSSRPSSLDTLTRSVPLPEFGSLSSSQSITPSSPSGPSLSTSPSAARRSVEFFQSSVPGGAGGGGLGGLGGGRGGGAAGQGLPPSSDDSPSTSVVLSASRTGPPTIESERRGTRVGKPLKMRAIALSSSRSTCASSGKPVKS